MEETAFKAVVTLSFWRGVRKIAKQRKPACIARKISQISGWEEHVWELLSIHHKKLLHLCKIIK